MSSPRSFHDVRTAVFRSRAQAYLLASMISFAGTIVVTRLFLELTGYPQLGGGVLHIAHVLWGGLLLFIAALLPLLLANRWALNASALLSGVGMGLFIDEVGKFITANNDYFFPAAAPIIYAFFLLVVILYLRVRRQSVVDSRQRLYRVLENMTEVLDHDLEIGEREYLLQQLQAAGKDLEEPALAQLSHALDAYLREGAVPVHPQRSTFLTRLHAALRRFEESFLLRGRMRFLLAAGLLAVGLLAWYELTAVLPALAERQQLLEIILRSGIQRGEVRSLTGATWFFIHLGVQTVVGLAAIVSAGLLAANKERAGVELGGACMVLALTAVNLLAFFVDQFSTAAIAIVQLCLLLGLAAYRRRFLETQIQPPAPNAIQ